MRKAPINKLMYARVRGLIAWVVSVAFVSLYFFLMIKQGPILWVSLMLIILNLGVVALLSLLPFGKFIESVASSEFKTYFRVAWFQFATKKYIKSPVEQPKVEQGPDRYYNVVILLQDHDNFVIERYPTLDTAEQRLSELKSIFS